MGYAGHDERREQILQAAARLLAESGMENVSVRRVAATAGIGMGTLRHYFPTQRDLHHAMVLMLIDDEIQDFDIEDPSFPPAERLERCVLQFVPREAGSEHLLLTWFGLYRAALDPAGPALARQFLEVSTVRAQERMGRWLTRLAEEGRLRADDVRLHTLRLSVLVSGACLELITPGSQLTSDDARSLITATVRSILGEDNGDDER